MAKRVTKEKKIVENTPKDNGKEPRQDLKEALAKERKQRMEACGNDLGLVLQKYRCRINCKLFFDETGRAYAVPQIVPED